MLLTTAPAGKELRIYKIIGKDDVRSRLSDMGFTEGSCVQIINEWKGSVIVCIRDVRIALDKTWANRIVVCERKGEIE